MATKYFEDLEEGATFTTGGRTITETDVVNFAGVSGDYNPIHTDIEHSKKGGFGERIAHGLLGLSVASGLAGQMGLFEAVVAFLTIEWKFKGPIKFNDTIHIETVVTKKRPVRDTGWIYLGVKVVNQENKTIQEGTWCLAFKKRPTAVAA
ncbi:MaoC/PaaZ C-terminal domain-containing protein [Elusimicrobiota bacterium]